MRTTKTLQHSKRFGNFIKQELLRTGIIVAVSFTLIGLVAGAVGGSLIVSRQAESQASTLNDQVLSAANPSEMVIIESRQIQPASLLVSGPRLITFKNAMDTSIKLTIEDEQNSNDDIHIETGQTEAILISESISFTATSNESTLQGEIQVSGVN